MHNRIERWPRKCVKTKLGRSCNIVEVKRLVCVLVIMSTVSSHAAVLSIAPQISSECEAYLKRVQTESSVKTAPRPHEFPADVFQLSLQQKPAEPKPQRSLMVKKETPKVEQPFWRTKPGLMERMERERQVLTSVTKSDVPNGEVKFDMKVAGLVNAPRGFAFKTAQAYPRLKEVADNFKTVHYRPEQNRLYLVMTALGYQERMILQIYPASGDGRDEIQFDVVWGNFKGMKGFIGFESTSLAKTEMSMIASYQSKTLPLPKILMGLALEAVTQKVAEKLRAFVERDYKQALKCGTL